MKILVTGATGYIGGQMAKRLSKDGKDVVCMTRGNKAVNSIPTIQGDLLNPESLLNACKGVDIICHFAGALGRGLTNDMIHAVNVDGVKNMITASKENGVKYFLHISSAAVTGPMGPTPANENTVCHPYTIYERTKLEGECLALSLAHEIGLPLSVVRPTFTYGPGDPHKLLMFKLIKKRLFFYIGDGSSTNHPVYIDDLLDGIVLMIEQRPNQEVYILGGPAPVSKKQWAETIAKELNVRPPFIRFPVKLTWTGAVIVETLGNLISINVPLTRSRVLAMSKYWGMSIDKARQHLGYGPKIDLSEGVANTVKWYKKEGWL
ncbi:MAG: NAD(P)-dependent oxidoreductase [Desulfosalsimonadaceae bacterium]|nr:NAD(P)-dependent oxidoreductase [Desulfosalsimonadaceae bacterium]